MKSAEQVATSCPAPAHVAASPTRFFRSSVTSPRRSFPSARALDFPTGFPAPGTFRPHRRICAAAPTAVPFASHCNTDPGGGKGGQCLAVPPARAQPADRGGRGDGRGPRPGHVEPERKRMVEFGRSGADVGLRRERGDVPGTAAVRTCVLPDPNLDAHGGDAMSRTAYRSAAIGALVGVLLVLGAVQSQPPKAPAPNAPAAEDERGALGQSLSFTEQLLARKIDEQMLF